MAIPIPGDIFRIYEISITSLFLTDFPMLSISIGAVTIQARTPYLDARRRLMLRWPNVPTRLQHFSFVQLTSETFFAGLELEMLAFYCQTFFDNAGHPPTIPYGLPT